MKRQVKNCLIALFAFAATCGLPSCGSADEPQNENIERPAYAEHSALYKITSPESDYQTIELTEGGNYIIAMNANASFKTPKRSIFSNMMRSKFLTRAGISRIIEGKYTVNSDGSYNLQGFGTVKVSTGSDGSVNTLDITLTNGSSVNLSAKIQNQLADSSMTTSLCRTWDIKNMNVKIEILGKAFFDKTYTLSQLGSLNKDIFNAMKDYAQKHDPEFDPSEWIYEDGDGDFDFVEEGMPTQVIFTKAGTYMVKYTDDTLAVSTWTWIDQKSGKIRYSWDYDDMYDAPEAGIVTVSFRDGGMQVTEVLNDESDDDDDMDGMVTVTITHFFTEAK